jgi:hypothetical protein
MSPLTQKRRNVFTIAVGNAFSGIRLEGLYYTQQEAENEVKKRYGSNLSSLDQPIDVNVVFIFC